MIRFWIRLVKVCISFISSPFFIVFLNTGFCNLCFLYPIDTSLPCQQILLPGNKMF